MNKTPVLINASNLHVGGGVQVAISVIDELAYVVSDTLEFHIVCSSEVDKGLEKAGVEINKFRHYEVLNIHGFSRSSIEFYRRMKNYRAIFTIFGPIYSLGKVKNSLVGFAQPWIVYPENEVLFRLSFIERLKIRMKLALQIMFYKRSSRLVVELPHVKESLIDKGIAKAKSVDVVYNTISNLYFSPNRWEKIDFDFENESFKLGFVGRDYLHKNLNILPAVKEILERDYCVNVEFYVTLKESEYEAKSVDFKRSVKSVGELSVFQCPSFYEKMDGVIFPSLLECFSATPLEALMMKRPLFASDRQFVRDVCEDYAYYFDPLSPESIARVIARYLEDINGTDEKFLSEGREHSKNFSSSKKRAESYIRTLEKMTS